MRWIKESIFFILCGGTVDVYRAFGQAVQNRREQVLTQMHFGAVYEAEKYGFSRDLTLIQSSFWKVLEAAQLGYTDFGYIHCIDEQADLDAIMQPGGLLSWMCELKQKGIVRHLGFSSHTPHIATQLIATGLFDLFMFSINPAYDYGSGEYSNGSVQERRALYQTAVAQKVGISVMKAFAGGQLLDASRSPLHVAFNPYQCIQYALDKPGVLTVLPGVASVADVKEILAFFAVSAEQKDYSILPSLTLDQQEARCVYCNHCAPCPQGLDIGLINKYYDLALQGDERAVFHYQQLRHHASDCVQCGHCAKRRPFRVDQPAKMKRIADYFTI